MKIEFMFPEVCALYGDYGNLTLIKQTFPNATFFETKIIETPKWVNEDIDFIYMGAMSEKTQEDVIAILSQHKKRLNELIESGTHIVFTGNAMDVLGTTIVDEHGTVHKALGIFDFETKINKSSRFNCLMLGTYRGMPITGFKTQFTMAYGNNEHNYFMNVEKGMGLNRDSMLEGFVKNNLIATNITGPLFVMNPEFSKTFFESMDGSIEIPYYDAMVVAQEKRIRDMQAMKVSIY